MNIVTIVVIIAVVMCCFVTLFGVWLFYSRHLKVIF